MSAKRFSTRSAPTRTCSSTAADCADGCPPMLGGDERRMKMAYSLAFSLPGTPVLFYGEEIGMAENLDIPGRLAVRIADAVDRWRQRRLLAGRPKRRL